MEVEQRELNLLNEVFTSIVANRLGISKEAAKTITPEEVMEINQTKFLEDAKRNNLVITDPIEVDNAIEGYRRERNLAVAN